MHDAGTRPSRFVVRMSECSIARLLEQQTDRHYTDSFAQTFYALAIRQAGLMGVMRFLIPRHQPVDAWPEAYVAYIGGPDGRVFPTQVKVEDNLLSCRRTSSDSGKLYVGWPVTGFGRPVIATTTLPERDRPYVLTVELARGKISQVRDQLSDWEHAGLATSDEFKQLNTDAYRLLTQSVRLQDKPNQASEIADRSLQLACQAAQRLVDDYCRQRRGEIRAQSSHLPVSLGCSLAAMRPDGSWEPSFHDAFDAAAVSIPWRNIEPTEGEYDWELSDAQMEWCAGQRLLALGGPLLDLAPDGLPQWLEQWEGDLPNLQSFLCDFIETAMSRYVGKIRIWEVCARVNTGGALRLNEEHRLMLAARCVEVARQVDEESTLLVGIEQPWGEYQARGNHRVSPLQFVDALLRSGVGLSGVNLEIGIGFRPRGTAFRDVLEFSRLIDLWSTLGIPLYITLAFPSAVGTDRHCVSKLEVAAVQWKDQWSESLQADWIDFLLPLLMTKRAVVAINWAHFNDAVPHEFPHAGLLRGDGTPKPSLQRIIRHRST